MDRKTTGNGAGQMREGVKIRHYIMDLIYRHPNERILIPGSNELAARFGVARSTVTLVLKSLTEQGYLEGRRGIGTFTKHQNLIPVGGKMPPLVGLLAGDGKYFYYPHQVWAVLAACGAELTRRGCNVRPLALAGTGTEALVDEISHQYLEALAMIDIGVEHLPLIRHLRERSSLRLAIQMSSGFDSAPEGVDVFGFDLRSAGVEVGRRLIAEGRRKLFFIFENPMSTELLEGIRSVPGTPEVIVFDWETPAVFPTIRSRLEQERPDAVYIHDAHYSTVRRMLDELNFDTDGDCRLIAEAHVLPGNYRGIVLELPFVELGRSLGGRVADLLSGVGAPAARRFPVGVRMAEPMTGEASCGRVGEFFPEHLSGGGAPELAQDMSRSNIADN